jgi:fructose-1,6-bisphosphatase/inositol monophosphatase family enzyme
METQTPEPNRSTSARSVSTFFSWLRALIGNLIQFAQRSQLEELGDQTRRLGSASVESATYVSGELRALDERLSRIEDELATLRGILEEGAAPIESAKRPARVASAPPNGD